MVEKRVRGVRVLLGQSISLVLVDGHELRFGPATARRCVRPRGAPAAFVVDGAPDNRSEAASSRLSWRASASSRSWWRSPTCGEGGGRRGDEAPVVRGRWSSRWRSWRRSSSSDSRAWSTSRAATIRRRTVRQRRDRQSAVPSGESRRRAPSRHRRTRNQRRQPSPSTDPQARPPRHRVRRSVREFDAHTVTDRLRVEPRVYHLQRLPISRTSHTAVTLPVRA